MAPYMNSGLDAMATTSITNTASCGRLRSLRMGGTSQSPYDVEANSMSDFRIRTCKGADHYQCEYEIH
jgi:hypothetical protein